jgi:hypothetical protein
MKSGFGHSGMVNKTLAMSNPPFLFLFSTLQYLFSDGDEVPHPGIIFQSVWRLPSPYGRNIARIHIFRSIVKDLDQFFCGNRLKLLRMLHSSKCA